MSEATVVGSLTAFNNQSIFFENYGGVVGDDRVFTDGGGSSSAAAIAQQTTTKHGSDNYGWKYSPTSTNRQATYPLEQTVAKLAVASGSLVTVSRWYQRDNTGLTIQLVCKAGQLNGVDNGSGGNIVATCSASINTWQQLTITFTPMETGVVALTEQCYGGTTLNGYSSDWSVSQA